MDTGNVDRLIIVLGAAIPFVCVAAVLIFRPLSSRLGELLGELKKERAPVPGSSAEFLRLTAVVEELADKVDQLERRNEFVERLLEDRAGSKSLPGE